MLSKSQFIRGRQCLKSLWLRRHRPDLRDEMSDRQEVVFSSGADVGLLAQKLFPGGIEFAYGDDTLAEQLQRTAAAIADGVTTLYEATFEHDGVLVKADILQRVPDGWELYEVKSSTGDKDVYVEDLAVQLFTLRGCGLAVARAFLIHIDSGYVRQGELDVQALFTKLSLTAEVEALLPGMPALIGEMKQILIGSEPDRDIGPWCDNPYPCDFKGHCWAHIPNPSVFDLRDRGRPDPFALYSQGIVRLEDVPTELLGRLQQLQVAGTLRQESYVDLEAIRSFLGELQYPLSYLDFESTFMVPVPLYDRSRPYQQIVFQFSLHIQDVPAGPIRHTAFLAQADRGDPRPAFIAALREMLPASGSIVAYNQGYEIGRLNGLADDFPELAADFADLAARFVDLMTLFRRREIYLWPQHGSYSIKQVLPAMVPDLSYEGLPIADGGAASGAWLEMLASDNPEEIAQIRKHLLDYCHLDTWAMVRIIDEFRRLVAETE